MHRPRRSRPHPLRQNPRPPHQLLDVRGAEEFAAGHVGGAVNIAYTRVAVRLGELPPQRPVFVHCGSGLRAAMAASFLAKEGIDVVHVDGGYGEIGNIPAPGA